MGVLVFISYATKDSNKFHIFEIAAKLTDYPEIDDVLYWEEDMEDDIIDYMNENVGLCDIFILFCSHNALSSEPVKMEWQAALKIRKKMIPVFLNEEHIPPLLTTKLGVQFNQNNLNETIENIYKLILKKAGIKVKHEVNEKVADVIEKGETLKNDIRGEKKTIHIKPRIAPKLPRP